MLFRSSERAASYVTYWWVAEASDALVHCGPNGHTYYLISDSCPGRLGSAPTASAYMNNALPAAGATTTATPTGLSP